MALQNVLHTIMIVVNCNLIIMLVCTFVGAVACTCARMLTCVCLYVSVFVYVNSWQQIVCVFAVIEARVIYQFNSALIIFSHDSR